MGQYIKNENCDISVIVNKALKKYKQNLIYNVLKHFENPYCAKAGTVKVITKNEIMKIIEKM